MSRQILPAGLCLAAFFGCAEPPPETPVPVAAAPPALQRLTRARYATTVQSLFRQDGYADVQVPKDLESDTLLHSYSSIGAAEVTISPRAAEQFEAAALELAGQLISDPARRLAFVGCQADATDPGAACVRRYIERFGLRAFRRPLSEQEVDEHLSLFRSLSSELQDPWEGLRYTIVAFLESPHFLYRIEKGEPDPARPDRLRYSSYEMASRLSYFLWNDMPDPELLDAAGRGELLDDESLSAQVSRMLRLRPAAEGALDQFLIEYLYLNRLDTVSKDATLFPEWTAELASALRQEVLLLMRDVALADDQDLRAYLTVPATYVNRELATFYGLPPGDTRPPGTWQKVPLLPGALPGLLGRAGVLALSAHATQTSPTQRGRFIRQQLLCQDVPPPPPNVSTILPAGGAGEKQTLRERLARHRQDPVCAGCHQSMDPLGLALEHFDPIGRYRATEDGLPIDPSGDFDGVAYADAGELAQLLRATPRIGHCFARQLYRHATGHLETPAEQGLLEQLGVKLDRDGFRFATLVRELVLSEGFRYARLPSPEAE